MKTYRSLLPLLFLLLSACSFNTYNTDALEDAHWNVKHTNGMVGKILSERLNKVSNPKGQNMKVVLGSEKFFKRVISVDESGNPQNYLQELRVDVSVRDDKTERLSDSMFTARQVPSNEQVDQINFHKKQMVQNLVNDIMLRLNEILAFKKQGERFKKALYNSLEITSKDTSKKTTE